jgi:glycosyltransferase involved in cell wall biosynthesis
MSDPLVSVVMGVFNGGGRLDASLRCILEQEDVALELVVVDDGSTDGTAGVLQRHAALDARVRVLSQPNAGLTSALIRGCAEARGRYIARQDAGDRSRPGRLARQVAYLVEHPEVTLVSCWTRYVGPCGEDLWLERRTESPAEATAALRTDDRGAIRGISCHSSAMFRKDDYLKAGGYRRQFRLAQDLDLWMRLTDFGQVAFVPECLCEYRYEPESLSGRYGRLQAACTDLIIAMRRCRAAGQDDAPLLEEAARISQKAAFASPSKSAGWYFLGKILTDRGDRRGLAYLRRAVRCEPWLARAWFWLLWRGATLPRARSLRSAS